MMNSRVTKYQSEVDGDISFLGLFYNVLFAPHLAAQQIKALREENSTQLFFFSILIVFLSSLGFSAGLGNLGLIFPTVILWLVTVVSVSLLAWLLRSRESNIDFGQIFFFAAFAQTPLVFLGIDSLWANSIIPNGLPTFLTLLWCAGLWGWALSNSLNLGSLKASILVVLAFVAPFAILIGLFIFTLIYLISSLS